MDLAFEYLEKVGDDTESDYPYTSGSGVRGTCNEKKAMAGEAKVKTFKDVTPKSEKALLAAITQQPVSIAVDAAGSAW